MAALVFDYDGLMVDSERVLAECVIELVRSRGGELSFHQIGHLFGSTESDAEWAALLPTWCDPPFTLAELEAAITPVLRPRVRHLPLLPGVRDLVERAAAEGWRLGIATGRERERLEPELADHGVLEHFGAIVTAADVPRGKPSPDIFLEVARRLDVDPEMCVVLEDSLPGCIAATAASMHVIVCPSVVGAHLEFPDGVRRVSALTDLVWEELLP